MASISKRRTIKGKLRWCAQVRRRGFPPASRTFREKTEAVEWAMRMETEILSGQYQKAQTITVADMIDRYIQEILKARGFSKIHEKIRQHHLEFWKRKIGDRIISAISPAIISAIRSDLLSARGKEKKTPSTVNRYLSSISSVFSVAQEEWKYLDHNPVQPIRRLPENNARERFLREPEIERLLQECGREKRKPLYLIVVLALSTAARLSELLNMRLEDVYPAKFLMVARDTKNGDTRALYFLGLATDLLKDHIKQLPKDAVFLFPSRTGRKPVRIEREFNAAVTRARLRDFRFHDLRHTAASYLAMNGASLRELAQILGHKTLNQVKRYTHLENSHCQKVVSDMNRRMFYAHQLQRKGGNHEEKL